jgi:predicted LPLAT superfamily acyltransferase
MNDEQCKIALSTFEKLKEKIALDKYHYSMQISTSVHDRIYIAFCSINKNSVVINEEHDVFTKLNNTRVVLVDFIEEYINHLSNIKFISLRELINGNNKVTIYYQQ